MRFLTLIFAVALALVAACDKKPEPRGATPPPEASAGAGGSTTTPANIGRPASPQEKKDGTNPVQGQVDPKEGVQHKDFQQRGDGAGPKSPK